MSAKRTLRLAKFVEALREQGLTKKESLRVANAVVSIWKAALCRGEKIELPIGSLTIWVAPALKPKLIFSPLTKKYVVIRRLETKSVRLVKNYSIHDCLN
jgi:hypothetical protein